MGEGRISIASFVDFEGGLHLLLFKVFFDTEDHDLQIDWLDDEVNRSQAYALCCHIDVRIGSAYLECRRYSSSTSSTASP